MSIRQPTKEWTKASTVAIDGQVAGVTRPWAIVDNVLWYGGTDNATIGKNTLKGISAGDGSVVAEIDIFTAAGCSYSKSDMGVDHNNYIWLNTQADGFVAGQPNYIVVDTVNRFVTELVGVSSGSLYGKAITIADKPNKLMWVSNSDTVLDAFNTETYAVSHSITVTSSSSKVFTVDETNGKLWVHNPADSTLKVYTSSTGVLERIVAAISGTQHIVSIPEKDTILLYDGTTTRLYSTVTYALLDSVTTPGSDVFYPTYYLPALDWIYGYYWDDAASDDYIVFYDYTTLTEQYKLKLTTGYETQPAGISGLDSSVYVHDYDNGGVQGYIHKLSISGLSLILGSGNAITNTFNTEIDYATTYNRELILDLTLEAFSVYDFSHLDAPKVHDYVQLSGYYLSSETVNVTDNTGNLVVDGTGAQVTHEAQVSNARTTDPRKEAFKYLVTSGTNATLAEYKDYSFTDWISNDGVGYSFDSYLITGYNLSGDMARKKHVTYLQIFCKRTEEYYTLVAGSVVLARQSSCNVQSQWSWNNSTAQGKWGRVFQAYRFLRPVPSAPASGDYFDYGETLIVTKNKLRGEGKALSLYIYSTPHKDLKLEGWNLLTTINGEP